MCFVQIKFKYTLALVSAEFSFYTGFASMLNVFIVIVFIGTEEGTEAGVIYG